MTVPSSLLDLQTWVARLLVRPLRRSDALSIPIYDEETNAEIAQKIGAGPTMTAQQRIGVYNQQYWFRLLNLLQEDYPALVRIFGYHHFNRQIAEPYLLKYVPNHWALTYLGGHLPDWISEFYQQDNKRLVLECARIDEAYNRLFFAQKLPSLTPNDLQHIEDLTINLQPCVALFEFDADLFAFRKQLLAQDAEYWQNNALPTVEWSHPHYFALSCSDGAFGSESISLGEFRILKAFASGSSLNDALSLSIEEDAVHIGDWFCKWAQKKWLFNGSSV